MVKKYINDDVYRIGDAHLARQISMNYELYAGEGKGN